MTQDEKSRPGVGTEAAREDLAKSLLTSVPAFGAADGDDTNDVVAGPDDPRWRAAEVLADAWGPALAASYRLGYDTGLDAGYQEAERSMQEAWSSVVRSVKTVLARPTQAELAQRRAASR